MDFLRDLFERPYPADRAQEVQKLLDDLILIGRTDDYLSERPGSPFNMQCRHNRAREIGKRMHDIGGVELMEWAYRKVKRKLGKLLADHLGYAWTDVGNWRF